MPTFSCLTLNHHKIKSKISTTHVETQPDKQKKIKPLENMTENTLVIYFLRHHTFVYFINFDRLSDKMFIKKSEMTKMSGSKDSTGNARLGIYPTKTHVCKNSVVIFKTSLVYPT